MTPASSLIRSGTRVVDLESLGTRAARAATGLTALGVRDGAPLVALLRNDLPLLEAMDATRLTGALFVPVNWHLTSDEVCHIVGDSGARMMLAHADLLPGLDPELQAGLEILAVATPPEIARAYRLDPERCEVPAGTRDWGRWLEEHPPLAEPAALPGSTMLYTSGTTGRPKGVRRAPMDPEALARYQRGAAETFGIRPGMRAVMTGPLYHSAPNAYARIGLALGCDLRLMPRFDPEELLALVESERLTHMHLVPTMMVRLLRLPEAVRSRYDVSSLESVSHGAAPCSHEVKRRMIEWWGPVFLEYYGSTEASLVTCASSEEWLARPGTVGRAVPGGRVEIHDDAGRRLAPGEVGEIYARVEGVPEFTYHRRPEERRGIERDGLITNGDVGYLDSDGYLYLCDRKRDMIIRGGVNVYPAEIEGALLAHPEVRDCAAFGIPDEDLGERVAMAVEPEDGAGIDDATLRAFLAERIARYKLPAHIEFHSSLPRLENGKIYKERLRAPHWEVTGRRI